jgi:hypothetical protein
LYRQSTGELFDPTGALIETGYSGAQPYVDKASAEWRKNLGPIPTGDYEIMPGYDHDNLGPVSMPLAPAPDNTMYGRDDFFCHGDNQDMDQSASQGCIIMSRSTRDMMNASVTRELTVVM